MNESQILRFMAVAGLAVALLVSAYAFFNSGIVGDSAGPAGAVEPLDSVGGEAPAPAAAASPATATTTESPDNTTTQTTATTTTSTTPSGNTYVIQSGDSFYTIARKYNTSIAQIQQLNPDLDSSNLKTGATVNVP